MTPNIDRQSQTEPHQTASDMTFLNGVLKPHQLMGCRNEILWSKAALLATIHIAGLYGVYLAFTAAVQWRTLVFAYGVYFAGGLGMTAGAHRLWTHRSYKATLPLRIFLIIIQTAAFETSVYSWARDHRVHHKYSETDADPHNARRGFFFSHCGWLCVRKNPLVVERGNQIPMDDLLADPVVRIQRKYYIPGAIMISVVLPTLTPWVCWRESLWNSFFVAWWARYLLLLHMTWLVNSAAHLWGNRPYDPKINPADNWWVSFCSGGEGWHNYHHTFPHDYSAAELGFLGQWNVTTLFIDTMAACGLAYDLKKVPRELIAARKSKIMTSHNHHHHSHD